MTFWVDIFGGSGNQSMSCPGIHCGCRNGIVNYFHHSGSQQIWAGQSAAPGVLDTMCGIDRRKRMLKERQWPNL